MVTPIISMNVFEAILGRRSVRNYTAEEVEPSIVNTLLEAAVRAPTAHHEEPWIFKILRGKQTLKALSDYSKPLFIEKWRQTGSKADDHVIKTYSDPSFNIFYNSSTLVIIGCISEGFFITADCWLAAENLMLAATATGLGTCIIGSALEALNTPEGKAMIGVPAKFTAVAPIIVGYPREDTTPASRKRPIVIP